MRWAGCNGQNGHGHAPNQALPGQPAPAHAVRIVLLSAEDSYAPILAAAVPGGGGAKTGADGSAANGAAHPSEEAVSASRSGIFLTTCGLFFWYFGSCLHIPSLHPVCETILLQQLNYWSQMLLLRGLTVGSSS